MRSKLIGDNPRTYALVLDTGDEVLTSLKSFAGAEKLASSSFKAIGALSQTELGWFDWEAKKYQTAVKLEDTERQKMTLGAVSTPELIHAGNPGRGAEKKPKN
jgi:hypothetical protein